LPEALSGDGKLPIDYLELSVAHYSAS